MAFFSGLLLLVIFNRWVIWDSLEIKYKNPRVSSWQVVIWDSCKIKICLIVHIFLLWTVASIPIFFFGLDSMLTVTFYKGYLGSHYDEERSEMRHLVWIAIHCESSSLWTHLAHLDVSKKDKFKCIYFWVFLIKTKIKLYIWKIDCIKSRGINRESWIRSRLIFLLRFWRMKKKIV